MRLLAHIGSHKTGTTAIQRLCHQRADVLKNAAILYPELARPNAHPFGHHLLPWSTDVSSAGITPVNQQETIDVKSTLKRMVAEAKKAKCSTVLVSSEDFWKLPEPGVFVDQAKAAGFKSVEALAYLRRQDYYFEALHSTNVFSFGSTAPFDATAMMPQGYYSEILDRWSAHASVEVRAYWPSNFVEGDVRRDFLQWLGIDARTITLPPERANPSYPLPVLEMLRYLQSSKASPETIAAYKELCRLAYRKIDRRGLMAKGERAHVLAAFANENRRLSESYFEGRPLWNDDVSDPAADRREALKSHGAPVLSELILDLRDAALVSGPQAGGQTAPAAKRA